MNRNIRVPFLLISLFTLLTFVLLFIFRAADDNSLTSWEWVFEGTDVTTTYLILLLGIIAAAFLSKISLPGKYAVVVLFSSSFLIASLFWRAPEVIVDVARYFTQAKHLEIYGVGYFFREWGRDIAVWTDLPLIPFLYGLIFKFFGESRVYIQIFTTFLFSMTVVLTYLIGKTLWDEEVGLFGGMLLLGIPYLFTQVPLMLVDVPAMFFLTFAIYTFIKALKCGGSWIPLASFALFLAFYSKYSAWLMLSVLIVIFIVYFQISRHPPLLKGDRGGLLIPDSDFQTPNLTSSELSLPTHPSPSSEGLGEGWLTLLLRGVLIVSIAGLLIGAVFLYKSDVFSEQIKLLISYQKPGLRRWEESFISTFFFQIHPFITASALYSVYAAFKKKDLKYVIIVWLVLLVVMLGIKRIRYIIMAFPMLTLMASYGLKGTRDKEIKRFVASCIIVSSIVIAMFAYLPFLQRMSVANLKEAGHFLDTLAEEDVVVFTLLQKEAVVNPAVAVPILDFHTDKRISYTYNAAFLPPREAVERSSLRFTWEYKNPAYYSLADNLNKKNQAVVIISSDHSKIPPSYEDKIKSFRIKRVFDTSDNVFSYKTFVTIYYK